MRIAIVQFPGSNCERETSLAVKRAGMQPEEFLWNESKEKLQTYDGFIIVGGFSYEDRSRAGIIAALDPLMQTLKEQSLQCKPILGICNGAQILVETGLVPGLENNKVGMVLTDNKRMQNGNVLGTGFYNDWVNIRLSDQYQLNAFNQKLSNKDILNIPVAHAEGRFVIPPALLKEMQMNGLNVFQYCDATGKIINEFPINPNGSVDNIAAVSNKNGNVMAMMPHPERTTNGDAIFNSMREYIQSGFKQNVLPLSYQSRFLPERKYQKGRYELIVELNINDNQAMSVQNALNHLGLQTKIKRYTHWEINCDSEETYNKIMHTGVLFNNRKESIKQHLQNKHILVRSKEDMVGQQKLQMLKHHFAISGLDAIHYGTLWEIEAENIPAVLDSHILFNPFAHDYYDYDTN